MKIAELRSKKSEELAELVISSKKELFNLRMQSASGQAGNANSSRAVKKTIARAKTLLNEGEKNSKNPASKKAVRKKKD